MSLQTILDAGYDYDNDCAIVTALDDFGKLIGFRHNIYNMNRGWTLSNQILATPEVKAFLIENDYRPINKRTNEQPFDTCWDYRKIAPDWPLFRNWLYVYYAYRHDQAEKKMSWYEGKSYSREELIRETARRDAYLDILEQLHDVRGDCSSTYMWGLEQEKKYLNSIEPTDETILTREWRDGDKRRKYTLYTYNHFVHTLYEYMELMEQKVMSEMNG